MEKWITRTSRVITLGAVLLLTLLTQHAHAQCVDPAGTEGDVTMNSTYGVPAYCDGSDNWVAMTGGDGRGYIPNAVNFGNITRLSVTTPEPFDGDSKTLTFSGWFRTDNTTLREVLFFSDTGPNLIWRVQDNTQFWLAATNGSTIVLQLRSNVTINPSQWNHVMMSADLASGITHVYVNGSEAKGFNTTTDDIIDFMDSEMRIGDTIGSNELYNGEMADLWIDNSYIDLSDPAERAKFIDTSGNPVYLGPNGELPTGNAPDIFFSGDTATWNENDGTGSDFSVTGGPLITAATEPYKQPTATGIVPDGLVGHWRLDETEGTTAYDSSGNGNDATLTNADFNAQGLDSAVIGRGFQSQENNDYIRASSASFPSGANPPFSYTGWYKPLTPAFQYYLFSIGNIAGDRVHVHLRDGDTNEIRNLRLSVNGTSLQENTVSGSQNIPVNVSWGSWVHFANVFDGSDFYIYKNGVLINQFPDLPGNGFNFNLTSPVELGISSDYEDTFEFGGGSDDVRIYNRALTADEIAEIYDARDGIRYNATYRQPEYFDGNKWAAMVPQWTEPGGAYAPASSSYADEVDALNPIVYYRMNDTSAMVDATGTFDGSYHNNPTLGEPPSPADPGGSSVYFDGATSEYARALDDPLFDTTQGTVIAWFNIDDASGGLEAVFAKDGGGDTDGQFFVGVNNGDIDGRVQQDGGSTTFTYDVSASALGADIQSGQWYMLSMAYGTGGVDFYLNDTLLGSETRLTKTDSDRNFLLASENSTGSTANYFTGFIDEVSWLPTKLDATAIGNLYNAGIGATGGSGSGDPSLVLHYKLDETEGTTAYDSSGNGNHATVINATFDDHRITGAVGTALSTTQVDPDDSFGNVQIDAPDLLPSSSSATFSIWARRTVNPADQSTRLLVAGGAANRYVLRWNDDLTLYYLPNGATTPITTAALQENVWHHIVATYNHVTDEYKLFVNGTEEGAQTDAAIAYGFFINSIGLTANGMIGAFDDARLYSRVLTDAEIGMLYQMGTPVGVTTALPAGCPNVGDVCDDGTIYAGVVANNNTEHMYVYPEDEISVPWNNGNSTNMVDVPGLNTTDGYSNTNILVVTDSDTGTANFQTHQSAQTCYDKIALGADDWYLPAQSEMIAIRDYEVDGIAEFNDIYPSGTFRFYQTSSQTNVNENRDVGTSNGLNKVNGNAIKWDLSNTAIQNVRCVRKGPAPRCANPYGLEGDMVYNLDHDVLQFCDGARWRAIGK